LSNKLCNNNVFFITYNYIRGLRLTIHNRDDPKRWREERTFKK